MYNTKIIYTTVKQARINLNSNLPTSKTKWEKGVREPNLDYSKQTRLQYDIQNQNKRAGCGK